MTIKMPTPVQSVIPVSKGGYLEHTNLESEIKKLPVHNRFWVKHLGGRTVQPFCFLVPSNGKVPVWANTITGTVHDKETGENMQGTLKIQFRAKL